MKIRSVEVRSASTGSLGSGSLDDQHDQLSHDDGSGSHHAAAAAASSRSRILIGRTRSRDSTSHEDNAVTSLSIALKELHTELRDKTAECEAMYETASALSAALQESERLLEAKTLECERLNLKLEMVTFREVDDEDDDDDTNSTNMLYHDGDDDRRTTARTSTRRSTIRDIVEEAEEMLARSHPDFSETAKAAERKANREVQKKKVAAAVIASQPKPKDDDDSMVMDEDVMPSDESHAAVAASHPHPGPVSVDDDFDPDDNETAEAHSYSNVVTIPQPTNDTGPLQAHFYQVIQERDRALQTVKKLSKEVKHARVKNKELKAKLDRSTTLNELAYFKVDSSSDKSSSKHQHNNKQHSKSVPKQLQQQPPPPSYQPPSAPEQQQSRLHVARQLSWLRRGTHNNDMGSAPPLATSDHGKVAAAEHKTNFKYLQAIAGSSDADQAAGVLRLDM